MARDILLRRGQGEGEKREAQTPVVPKSQGLFWQDLASIGSAGSCQARPKCNSKCTGVSISDGCRHGEAEGMTGFAEHLRKGGEISCAPSGWTFCFQNQLDACYGMFPPVLTDTQHVFQGDFRPSVFLSLAQSQTSGLSKPGVGCICLEKINV